MGTVIYTIYVWILRTLSENINWIFFWICVVYNNFQGQYQKTWHWHKSALLIRWYEITWLFSAHGLSVNMYREKYIIVISTVIWVYWHFEWEILENIYVSFVFPSIFSFETQQYSYSNSVMWTSCNNTYCEKLQKQCNILWCQK